MCGLEALLFVGAASLLNRRRQLAAGGRPYTGNEAAEITGAGADGSSAWVVCHVASRRPDAKEVLELHAAG